MVQNRGGEGKCPKMGAQSLKGVKYQRERREEESPSPTTPDHGFPDGAHSHISTPDLQVFGVIPIQHHLQHGAVQVHFVGLFAGIQLQEGEWTD